MIEKAFYSGFRLHPGEIGYVLVPRLVSVWVSALCKLKHSSPGIPDLFVEKKRERTLRRNGEGKNSVLAVSSLSVVEEVILIGFPSSYFKS